MGHRCVPALLGTVLGVRWPSILMTFLWHTVWAPDTLAAVWDVGSGNVKTCMWRQDWQVGGEGTVTLQTVSKESVATFCTHPTGMMGDRTMQIQASEVMED